MDHETTVRCQKQSVAKATTGVWTALMLIEACQRPSVMNVEGDSRSMDNQAAEGELSKVQTFPIQCPLRLLRVS